MNFWKLKVSRFQFMLDDSISILPIANITAKSTVQLFQKRIEKKKILFPANLFFQMALKLIIGVFILLVVIPPPVLVSSLKKTGSSLMDQTLIKRSPSQVYRFFLDCGVSCGKNYKKVCVKGKGCLCFCNRKILCKTKCMLWWKSVYHNILGEIRMILRCGLLRLDINNKISIVHVKSFEIMKVRAANCYFNLGPVKAAKVEMLGTVCRMLCFRLWVWFPTILY